jgi:hypothetical protein
MIHRHPALDCWRTRVRLITMHPAAGHHKFYQWCVGGNGGVTRQPAMKLHQHEMDRIRMAYRMIGISPAMDDNTFIPGIPGRANTNQLARTG